MRQLDLADLHISGINLIEASAGTGKTWTISALYILLLLENRLRPEEILVVTYTRSATAELRDRIRSRISDTLQLYISGRPPRDELEKILFTSRCTDAELAVKLLTRALYSFDDAAIFTIHGFCQRALVENAFESGSLFDTELVTDQSRILRDVCDDYWRSTIQIEEDAFLKRLISGGFTPEKLAEPFKGHVQNPELQIIPAAENPDLGAICIRCMDLAQQVSHTWSSDRAAIIELLIRSNLSQTSYKPVQIDTAARGLTAWLSAGDNSSTCPALRLFTTAAIRAGQKKGSSVPDHPLFDAAQQLWDALQMVDRAFDEKVIYHRTALHRWIQHELATRKRSLNVRCYDDLLLDLHRALTGETGEQLALKLRQRYRAALIDEFQDTDPLQWQIFNCIGAREEYPLFLIGDPKQAIYSFRGADVFAYIAAGHSVAEENRATIDTNRRSLAPLVTAVNALFMASDDPFLCREIGFNPVKSGRDSGHNLLRNGQPVEQPLQFWVYQREEENQAARKPEASADIVRTVAEEIARLLDGTHEIVDHHGRRALKPGDIAVLVKAHYQADLVQNALSGVAIPSVQRGSTTIFQTIEALDMLRIMRAVQEPARERLVREALLTGTMGVTADEIAGFLTAGDASGAWETWLLRFRSLQVAAVGGGVVAMVERLLDECGIRLKSLARIGGERILTNILQCTELLHTVEREQSCGLESLILWLELRITAEMEDENALLRLETDENAVQIATIHASKGLEYPVVFLPFAWDASASRNSATMFHDSAGSLTLDLGSDAFDEHKILAKRERAAEAARLLYVALTRAEFLCYVTWGCIGDAQTSPLFNLLHGATVNDPKSFKSYPDRNILADVAACGIQAPGLAGRFMPLDTPFSPYTSAEANDAPPVCRTLVSTIASDWRVTSFTGIVAGSEKAQQPHDYDALTAPTDPYIPDPDHQSDDLSIFHFPRGAAAGTCLHRIFEQLDFSAATSEHISRICRTTLLSCGYQEQWLPAVAAMTEAAVSAPLILDDSTFTLSQLPKGAWLTEMEFYLPLLIVSPDNLRTLFAGLLNPELHGSFHSTLESMDFKKNSGMIHGFMDMVFEHRNRYYIIDWKSNHLGISGQNYSQANMILSMVEHSYILQYHFYTLALDRHLRQRLPDYDYETHFGGCIYIYLRGVSRNSGDIGIYRDRPAPEFIRRASGLLLA